MLFAHLRRDVDEAEVDGTVVTTAPSTIHAPFVWPKATEEGQAKLLGHLCVPEEDDRQSRDNLRRLGEMGSTPRMPDAVK